MPFWTPYLWNSDFFENLGPPPRFSKFRICNSDFFDFGAYPPPFLEKFQNFPDFFFDGFPIAQCCFLQHQDPALNGWDSLEDSSGKVRHADSWQISWIEFLYIV